MSTYNFNVEVQGKKFPALEVEDEYRFILLLVSESVVLIFGIRILGRTRREDGNGTAEVARNTARFKMSFLRVSNLF